MRSLSQPTAKSNLQVKNPQEDRDHPVYLLYTVTHYITTMLLMCISRIIDIREFLK